MKEGPETQEQRSELIQAISAMLDGAPDNVLQFIYWYLIG